MHNKCVCIIKRRGIVFHRLAPQLFVSGTLLCRLLLDFPFRRRVLCSVYSHDMFPIILLYRSSQAAVYSRSWEGQTRM